jgi:hypothetical protein
MTGAICPRIRRDNWQDNVAIVQHLVNNVAHSRDTLQLSLANA